jgi:cell volume regulation protein A
MPPRGSPQVFTVRPVRDDGDDPSAPENVGGIPVVAVLRSRRERPSALVTLADGRYSVITEGVVAVGGRQALARWCERRAEAGGDDPAERAWWQEVIGALVARG